MPSRMQIATNWSSVDRSILVTVTGVPGMMKWHVEMLVQHRVETCLALTRCRCSSRQSPLRSWHPATAGSVAAGLS